MRMWMVDPVTMCRAHLMGEHVETHMFLGAALKGTSMKGYLEANMLEPAALKARHDAIADEMARRGYNHASPMAQADHDAFMRGLTGNDKWQRIDRKAARAELHRRCSVCRMLASA